MDQEYSSLAVWQEELHAPPAREDSQRKLRLLCSAPRYGAAKDPTNVAGMIAANARRGAAPLAHWEDIENTNAFILDVRNPVEYVSGHVDRALNIPLNELRSRMHELPSEREIWIYCDVDQRSYYAVRALRLNQFKARNLSGGIHAYKNLAQSWVQ